MPSLKSALVAAVMIASVAWIGGVTMDLQPVSADEITWFDFATSITKASAKPTLDVSNEGGAIYVVGFDNPDGGTSTMSKSTNGGTTWTSYPVPNDIRNSDPFICVVNDSSLFLVTGGAVYDWDNHHWFIYTSDNSGQNWNVFYEASNLGHTLNPVMWVNSTEDPAPPESDDIYVAIEHSLYPYSDYRIILWTQHGGQEFNRAISCEGAAYPSILVSPTTVYTFFKDSLSNLGYPIGFVKSLDWGRNWGEPLELNHTGTIPGNPDSMIVSRSTFLDYDRGLMSITSTDSTTTYGTYGYFWYSNETFQPVNWINLTNLGATLDTGSTKFNAVYSFRDGALHLSWMASPTSTNYATLSKDHSGIGLIDRSMNPIIVNDIPASTKRGNPFSATVLSTPSDNPPINWLLSTNASWLSIASSTNRSCALSGTPASTGTFFVNLTASDGNSSNTKSWTIAVWKDPVYPIVATKTPEPSSIVLGSPEKLEINFTRGDPELAPTDCLFTIDGHPLAGLLGTGNTASAEVPFWLLPGMHMASVTVTFSGGVYAYSTWSFTTEELFVLYEHDSGFRVPVPYSWNLEEDQVSDSGVTELVLTPTYESISSISIDTGIDVTVREDVSYLMDFYDFYIQTINEEGLSITVVSGPDYTKVANHSAIIVKISVDSTPIYQKLVVVVSDKDDRFWMLVLTSSTDEGDEAEEDFDVMVAGFQITLDEGPEEPGTDEPTDMGIIYMAAIGAVVGGVAAALAAILMASRRRKADASAQPSTVVQASGVSVFCPNCGSLENMANSACGRCGKSLPSPPFGAVPPKT